MKNSILTHTQSMVMNSNQTLSTLVTKHLPALSGSSLTYNPAKQVFLTMGYTSRAGNTYYKAIRVSDRLAIYYDLGEGYAHTFLNGITLFCWDGQEAKVIARRSWGGCNYRIFNEGNAKMECVDMLREFMSGQLKASGAQVGQGQLMEYSREMVNETHQQRLLAV